MIAQENTRPTDRGSAAGWMEVLVSCAGAVTGSGYAVFA